MRRWHGQAVKRFAATVCGCLLAAGCADLHVVVQASNDGGPFYFVGLKGGSADLPAIDGMDLVGGNKSHSGEGGSGGGCGGGCCHGGCGEK